MSHTNIKIVRAILADWAKGDYSSVAWADPQIEFIADDSPSVTRGVGALGPRWREFLMAWDHLATKPEEFIDVGDDRVLVLVRFEGRGRGSGIPASDFCGAQMFRLQDGMVVQLFTYLDREKALKDAGLQA